jgi:hypothetical protein
LPEDELPRIRAQCEDVIRLLIVSTPNLGLVSALAEGADRLVADIALAQGCKLHCILPFPAAEYERDFASPDSVVEFRRLLARACHRRELPGDPAARAAAYDAAGRAMLDECRALIAIWDGAPAAGQGGSADMIEEAAARSIPVIWVHSQENRPPLLRFHGDTPFATSSLCL